MTGTLTVSRYNYSLLQLPFFIYDVVTTNLRQLRSVSFGAGDLGQI